MVNNTQRHLEGNPVHPSQPLKPTQHPRTPEVLEAIWQRVFEPTAIDFESSQDLSDEAYERLEEARHLEYEETLKTLLEIARDPRSPPAFLRRVFRQTWHDPYPMLQTIAKATASNPNSPLDVLGQAAEDFPEAVFANPVIPLLNLGQPDWLDRINSFYRKKLIQLGAQHLSCTPNAKEETLEAFSESPNVTPAQLAVLALSSHEHIRRRMACHARTPAATLEHLARDPDEPVRAGAACHPNTPSVALERLVTDPSFHVRVTMAEGQGNLRLLERLALDEDFVVVASIANSQHPISVRRLAWKTLLNREPLPIEVLD